MKFIECIYLGIAILAVYGIVETQSSIAKSLLEAKKPELISQLEGVNECKKEDAKYDRPESCVLEEWILIWLKMPGWQGTSLKYLRDYWYLRRSNKMTPLNERFWDKLDEFTASNENEISVIVEDTTSEKLFGFYLLCIGICLRLTRTIAEIFEWHVPKA